MKTKIVIAGIGGVGGYFGGLLARHYHDKENVEIHFVARGAHLKEIQQNGLKVIKGVNEFIARPASATDNPAEIGVADVLIIATKSYDLEAVIHQLRPCINQDTIVLPLLNGLDGKELLTQILPGNTVLAGCVYLVSRLKQPGVIENSGNIETLYFGLDNTVNEQLLSLESLFREAGIEAFLSSSISTIIWEKFIFLSPIATATSYFDGSIGAILSDKEKVETVGSLIGEVIQLVKAKEIIIPEDITERTMGKLRALPFETTSSMHADFKSNKPNNELKSLTGYVVREGQEYGIEMPVYRRILGELQNRTGN